LFGILLYLYEKLQSMEKAITPVGEQIKRALDGRTQRWLSFEVRIAEQELSKKMNGSMDFTVDELAAIEERLNFKFDKNETI
jgi:hypothetical protein